jgi:hypothetical protein
MMTWFRFIGDDDFNPIDNYLDPIGNDDLNAIGDDDLHLLGMMT